MSDRFSRPARSGKLFLTAAFLLVLVAGPATALPVAQGFQATGEGPLHGDTANGTRTQRPSLEARRIEPGAIVLDGVLDEDAWAAAPVGWGFQQHEPDRGVPVSVPTTFKILYDDDALYVGVACWEDDIADVASYLSRRDDIQASDLVSIYLDPYHDRTTGYNFRVTADGVKYDAYLFDNGSRDSDWNAVWEAEVAADARGWYLEMRIPFAAIRFKPEPDMTWGLQVYRWLHGRGEDTGWVLWDRNASGFVSRWGNLTGLKDVDNPRRLEITPYVVTRHTDPAAVGDADTWQNFQDLGADFKYGVTANLTLNGTFQPDFGQVEADPATLNLSPFETYYQEKRPFFTEGARFFQHPDFNLFYSRRIGTGDPNSRIRGAAKLTGKIGGDISLAVLAAATDVGQEGKVHNPFAGGSRRATYGLVRVGKEFDEGNHSINVMGTAVRRDQSSANWNDDPRVLRDGYSGGLDFLMSFKDRNYRLRGSVVGTAIDPFDDITFLFPNPVLYGTGGYLEAAKTGGKLRARLAGGWESDRLDPNDMGFLDAPDEKYASGSLEYNYDSDGQDSPFNTASIEVEAASNWVFAAGRGRDYSSGEEVWSYGSDHRLESVASLEIEGQHRTYHQGWLSLTRHFDGTDKYATRGSLENPGPLMDQPGWISFGAGFTSDWRQPLSLSLEFSGSRGDHLESNAGSISLRWNQNRHVTHSLGFGVRHNVNDAQWMLRRVNDGSQPGVSGIGGIDHVFGKLDQMTWDLTLRSSVLFNRDQSLQLYLQPYLTYGDYADPRWLATADSYDLRPYDLDAAAHDFRYGALNLSLVYRWEYRPGSTIFLVWTHSKERYERRGESALSGPWDNDFEPGFVTGTEPENTFLAKFSYWFSI